MASDPTLDLLLAPTTETAVAASSKLFLGNEKPIFSSQQPRVKSIAEEGMCSSLASVDGEMVPPVDEENGERNQETYFEQESNYSLAQEVKTWKLAGT